MNGGCYIATKICTCTAIFFLHIIFIQYFKVNIAENAGAASKVVQII